MLLKIVCDRQQSFPNARLLSQGLGHATEDNADGCVHIRAAEMREAQRYRFALRVPLELRT
ncbi:MAG: hypothetical protein ACXWJK_07570 [Burkholderiaceae bacterium]